MSECRGGHERPRVDIWTYMSAVFHRESECTTYSRISPQKHTHVSMHAIEYTIYQHATKDAERLCAIHIITVSIYFEVQTKPIYCGRDFCIMDVTLNPSFPPVTTYRWERKAKILFRPLTYNFFCCCEMFGGFLNEK